jgi:MFS family permease
VPHPDHGTPGPLDWRVALPAHALAITLVQSTSWAMQGIVAVLAIKRFGAADWQSLIVTAAPTVFYSLSIFWGAVLRQMAFGRYLAYFWVVASLPLFAMARADTYWQLTIPFLVLCAGGAGYPPVNGEVLLALYPPTKRGSMYGVLWGTAAVATAAFGYAMGLWLEHDEGSFRVFLPLVAVLQGVGAIVFAWLIRASGHADRRVIEPASTRGQWAKVIDPITHMGRILKADPVFARYEAAYMTYGVGWMITAALTPILVTRKLNLNYDDISLTTQVAYLLALVPALWPAGRMMDRLGAIRSTGLSFFLLTFYPLALIVVRDQNQLLLASVFFGLAHAGASVGWTVGPVSLAPTPEKVNAYAAIHATMVGIRGKLFQGLGVLLYYLSEGFTLPLAVAAGAYLWSALQMRQLDARTRKTPAGTPGS